MKKYQNQRKIYKEIKKRRLARPIPENVLPGGPRKLPGDLLSLRESNPWSIWSTPRGTQHHQHWSKSLKMRYQNLMIFRDASQRPSQRVSEAQSDLQSMKIDEITFRTEAIRIFQKGMNF